MQACKVTSGSPLQCRSIGQKSTFQKARSKGDAGSFEHQVRAHVQRVKGLKG